MKSNSPEIDFVIPWVDGNDAEWIKEFNKYCPEDKKIVDVSKERYRDYGLLKYWFRGIEKFTPWVRKVHFITCGQKPEWLNTEAPKLNWVKHSDYIPREYLPVFSANPIELYMNHIDGLAENFVYFNDDFFLTKPTSPEFFFKNGKPCDAAVLNAISTSGIGHIIFNDNLLINKFFNKREVLKKNFSKWINLKYGPCVMKTILLLPWPHFTSMYDFHLAQPFTKSLLDEVWSKCSEELSDTMTHRFRDLRDVNQWLFRYWLLCKGNFYPVNPYKRKKYFELNQNIDEITEAISRQKYNEIVLNDAVCEDFDARMKLVVEAFEKILPEKSSFEL